MTRAIFDYDGRVYRGSVPISPARSVIAALLVHDVEHRRNPAMQLNRVTFDFFRAPGVLEEPLEVSWDTLKTSSRLEQHRVVLRVSGELVAQANLLFIREDVAENRVTSPLSAMPSAGLATASFREVKAELTDVSIVEGRSADGLVQVLLAFPLLSSGLDLTLYATRPMQGDPVAMVFRDGEPGVRQTVALIHDTIGPFAIANAVSRSFQTFDDTARIAS